MFNNDFYVSLLLCFDCYVHKTFVYHTDTVTLCVKVITSVDNFFISISSTYDYLCG